MKFVVKSQFAPVSPEYKQPVGNDIFLKMAKAGSPIKFIIIGQLVTGYSYWTEDKRCIRSREKPAETNGIKMVDGKPDRVAHFWIIPCWDCTSESVKLLEVTQRGLQDQLLEIFNGSDYNLGDLSMPTAIKISATGEKLLTKYTLMPVPVQEPDLCSKLIEGGVEDLDIDELVFAASVPKAEGKDAPSVAPNPVMSATQAADMM